MYGIQFHHFFIVFPNVIHIPVCYIPNIDILSIDTKNYLNEMTNNLWIILCTDKMKDKI